MHWENVQMSWHELGTSMKTRWSRLTDDDLQRANGRLDELVRALQQRYGVGHEDARRQVEKFSDEVAERMESRRLFSHSPTAD